MAHTDRIHALIDEYIDEQVSIAVQPLSTQIESQVENTEKHDKIVSDLRAELAESQARVRELETMIQDHVTKTIAMFQRHEEA